MVILSTPIIGEITVLDLIIFATIISVSIVIAKIAGIYLKKHLSDRIKKDEMIKIIRFTQLVIIIIGVFISLPRFKIDFGELLLIGGAAGVVIGFATQRLATNIGSGLVLIFERPVQIGDSVKIGDTVGTVDDIRILSTTIKTHEGIYVRIPNEAVFNSEITNYVANVARRFEYRIGIRYTDDAEHAIKIINALLASHPLVLNNPAPKIYVDELGESSVIISIRVWAPSNEWWSVRTELLLKIKVALEEEGIEIPFPQREIWFAKKQGRGENQIGGDGEAAEEK